MPLKTTRKKRKSRKKKGRKVTEKSGEKGIQKMIERFKADEQILHGQAHAIEEGKDTITYNEETKEWENTDNYKNIGKSGKIKIISFK